MRQAPASHDVDVWRVRPPAAVTGPHARQQMLDAAELARAARFQNAEARARFVTARAALRLILAGYSGDSPENLSFSDGAHGKPELIGSHADKLHFNVSHSAGLIIIAVTTGNPLGVDVEFVDPDVDWVALSRKICTERERARLAALPDDEGRAGFFRCWTRKEAYVKARGDGFALPLIRCEVSVTSDGPPRIENVPGGPAEIERWSLQDIAVQAGYAGALVAARGARVRACQDFELHA